MSFSQKWGACLGLGSIFFAVGLLEDLVGEPGLEAVVVHELFEELGVVVHDRNDRIVQGLIVLDPSVLLVRVLLGILVRNICVDDRREIFGDYLSDAVLISPRDVAKQFVE